MPTQFSLPSVIPVIDGLSGAGTAILTFHSSTACTDVFCTYHGASSAPRAVTLEDKVLGQIYVLQSCSDDSNPNAVLAVTSIGLHVTSGDTGTPFVQIQIVKSYPADQGITVFPPPEDPGPLVPISQLGDGSDLPPSPETAAANSWQPSDLPSPDSSLSSPEVNGSFTAQADPYLVPLDPFGN